MKEIVITWKREYYQPDESKWNYQMGIKIGEKLDNEDYELLKTIGETLDKFKKETEEND